MSASNARNEDHLAQGHNTATCDMTITTEDLQLNHSEAEEYSEEQTGHLSVFHIWPGSTSISVILSPTLICYITFHSRPTDSSPFQLSASYLQVFLYSAISFPQ